jgi:transposase-like protein
MADELAEARARLLAATQEAFPHKPKPPAPARKIDLTELAELVRHGCTRSQAAEHFGCSTQAISSATKRAGLPPFPHPGKPRSIDRTRAVNLIKSGKSVAQTARELGCSPSSIRDIKKEHGLTGEPRKPLAPERLARIESMLDDGWSYEEVHRTEGASEKAIRRYFPGRGWTNQQSGQHAALLRRAS